MPFIGVHYVSDGVTADDLATFGRPSVHVFHKPFIESLRNHILIVDTNGRLITSYKIGSSIGFDPAYQIVDSILLHRGIAGIVNFKNQPLDTLTIPIHWPLLPSKPLQSRFSYSALNNWLEVFSDSIGGVLCIDTAGSIQRHSDVRLLSNNRRSDADTLIFTQFVSIDKDSNTVAVSLRCYAPIDTVIFGERENTFYSKYDQIVTQGSLSKSLILNPEFGHFTIATDDVKHLWMFDDPSALQLQHTSHILHMNLRNRSFDSITINIPDAIPAMYFTTSCGKICYILPDSGKMIEIDTSGKCRFQAITTGKLPGWRRCTYPSGSSKIGVIQEVDGKCFAIFFNLNGRRITQPILLPPTPAYAALLDSGILLVLTQDNVTKTLKLYRSKIS